MFVYRSKTQLQHPTAFAEAASTLSGYQSKLSLHHGSFDHSIPPHKMSYHKAKDNGPLVENMSFMRPLGSVSYSSPLPKSVSYTRPLVGSVYSSPLAEGVSYTRSRAESVSYAGALAKTYTRLPDKSARPQTESVSYTRSRAGITSPWAGSSRSRSTFPEITNNSLSTKEYTSNKSPVVESSYWTLWMKDFTQTYKVSSPYNDGHALITF